jgi:SAM-dependent methyltransferase
MLKTINLTQIHELPPLNKVEHYHWEPIPEVNQYIVNSFGLTNLNKRILDVGGGMGAHFPNATHIIDIQGERNNTFKVDIDFDTFPFSDQYFDFCYCRHTLEDIQNPIHAFQEIVRVSKCGYIETPSPLCRTKPCGCRKSAT